MAPSPDGLTVAVTGPTGTFGSGLIPLLEADPRIGRVVGIARRPFDPADRGWSKMVYRQGDVRDRAALESAFAGADVVVHLAFLITGTASRETTRTINVDGTVNAFRAAASEGARRFVFASSAAAYGFHRDNPLGMTEDWPIRPADRLFYSREKAEVERTLQSESTACPALDLYVLRPPIVVGPHGMGAKDLLPRALAPGVRTARKVLVRSPVPIPAPVPDLALQLVHEDDVGQALQLCVVGAGPAGAYNIAGQGTVTAHDVAHALGLAPLPFPVSWAQAAGRTVSRIPLPSGVPPVSEWAEAVGHPVIIDSTKARRELGWSPRYTGLGALLAALPSDGAE